MPLTIVFAGTPSFAVPVLEKLLTSEHQIIAVYTQPDRPAGRGRQLSASPVKQVAQQHALPIYQPESLRDTTAQQQLAALHPDVMVVVGYGMILPEVVLNIPKYGCLNVHPSLLPKWRGATPVQSAILAGDTETGVAVMQLDKGMDSGDILQCETTTIGAEETSGELYDRLFTQGADLLLRTLADVETQQVKARPQQHDQATFAKKITKAQAEIDWQLPASKIHQQIRAFNPWPVAYTYFKQQPLKIWQASPVAGDTDDAPGTIVEVSKTALDIATGQGILRLQKVQQPGKKAMAIKDFINANQTSLKVGELIHHHAK